MAVCTLLSGDSDESDSASLGKYFQRVFPFLTEIEQPSFTHRVEGYDDGKKIVVSLGRIDRVYALLPPALIIDLSRSSGAIGCAADIAQL
eukprot:4744627-Pyramimonas_sp.AAC.1